MIEYRDYQVSFENALREKFREHRRVLGVASTGAGKTRVFAGIATKAAAKGKRVVILGHRSEIIDQIGRALDDLGVRHGWIKPGHTFTADHIQVASVATLGRRLGSVPEPDLVIVDEAHHALAGTWEKIAEAWTRARYLGVTATPVRSDGKGLGKAFDVMVETIPMSELIEKGYLAGYEYYAPAVVADLSAVKTRMGDYAIDELADAMDKAVVTGSATAEYTKALNGRPAIVFCCTVAHAEHVAEQFRAAGYRAASVDGAMEATVRKERIASIGDGRLNILTSCNLISEGTDIPAVAGAILLRPTKSVGLYLQMVGRCLRPKKDGSKAVILDHVSNVERHGMPDTPREWSLNSKLKKSGGVATCKQCFRAFDTKPGWKAEYECLQEPSDDCILNAVSEGGAIRSEIEVVDGNLVQFTTKPDWADGLDLASARGPDFGELLTLADTPEKLKQVAKARGYKHQWVHHVMKSRGQRSAAA